GQGLAHLLLGDALVVVIDDGVLQQLVFLDHFGELVGRDEEVIAAVYLAGAGGARGGGDHKVERQPALLHALDDGVFADAGRPGDHNEQRLAVMMVEGVGHEGHLERWRGVIIMYAALMPLAAERQFRGGPAGAGARALPGQCRPRVAAFWWSIFW